MQGVRTFEGKDTLNATYFRILKWYVVVELGYIYGFSDGNSFCTTENNKRGDQTRLLIKCGHLDDDWRTIWTGDFVCFWRESPPSGPVLPHSRGFSVTHNDAPQSVGLLWTSDQLVAETSTWQRSQQANIHAPGRIRTHNLSRRMILDPAATGKRGLEILSVQNRVNKHISTNVVFTEFLRTKSAFCLYEWA